MGHPWPTFSGPLQQLICSKSLWLRQRKFTSVHLDLKMSVHKLNNRRKYSIFERERKRYHRYGI